MPTEPTRRGRLENLTPCTDVMEKLLLAGADPSITSAEGETPLYTHRPYPNCELVCILLRWDADIMIPTKEDVTPIQLMEKLCGSWEHRANGQEGSSRSYLASSSSVGHAPCTISGCGVECRRPFGLQCAQRELNPLCTRGWNQGTPNTSGAGR